MKKLMFVVLGACAIAACTPKEAEISRPVSSAPKAFTASIEDATRVYQDGLTLCWNAGDEVTVFAMSDIALNYTFAGNDGDVAGELAAPAEVPATEPSFELPYNYAAYPAHLIGGIDETGAISVNLNGDQIPAEDGCIDTHYSNLMVARSEGESLSFKNALGFLKISLYNSAGPLSIGEIDILANGEEPIAGAFTVSFDDDGLPVLTPSGDVYCDAWQDYVDTWGEQIAVGEDEDSAMDFYFLLPPGTYPNGFSVNVWDEYGAEAGPLFSSSVSTPVTIYRNKITSFPVVDLGVEAELPPVEAAVYTYDIDQVYSSDLCEYYGMDNSNSFAFAVFGNDLADGMVAVLSSAEFSTMETWDEVFENAIEFDDDDWAGYADNGYIVWPTLYFGYLEPETRYYVFAYLGNTSGNYDIFYSYYDTAAAEVLPEYPDDLELPVVFAEDFEEGAEGWTLVDSDKDGFNWQWFGGEESGMTAHDGNGVLCSASYDNDTSTPLTPDNWAVSPAIEITGGNFLSFWVGGQDKSYFAEHVKVYIKTEAPDESISAGDDEPILAYTIGDEGYAQIMSTSGRKFYRFVIDLSVFEGQTIYLAFRHCDVTDMFWLNLDDVVITEGNPIPAEGAPKAALKKGAKHFTMPVWASSKLSANRAAATEIANGTAVKSASMRTGASKEVR